MPVPGPAKSAHDSYFEKWRTPRLPSMRKPVAALNGFTAWTEYKNGLYKTFIRLE
jgi:hypothetical protein